VITWPPGPRGGGAGEAQARQIKLVDEKIDDADEAVFTDLVIQLIREKHRLAAINALDEPRHSRLRLTCGSLP